MQDTIEGREGPPDQDRSRARNSGRCRLTPSQPRGKVERVMRIEPTWVTPPRPPDQSLTGDRGSACDWRV